MSLSEPPDDGRGVWLDAYTQLADGRSVWRWLGQLTSKQKTPNPVSQSLVILILFFFSFLQLTYFWNKLQSDDIDFCACGLCLVDRQLMTSVWYPVMCPGFLYFVACHWCGTIQSIVVLIIFVAVGFQISGAIATYLVILLQLHKRWKCWVIYSNA